jgi:hypothetical protein
MASDIQGSSKMYLKKPTLGKYQGSDIQGRNWQH